METDTDRLKANLRRWTLILGVLQITVGCVVGFIPPSAVAWFRGIVMAHIEFTANGVLMVVFGLLVREICLSSEGIQGVVRDAANGHVDERSSRSWWRLSSAHRRNSCRRPTRSSRRPTVPTTRLFPASLLLCGVTIMVALLLTLYGLLRPRKLRCTTRPSSSPPQESQWNRSSSGLPHRREAWSKAICWLTENRKLVRPSPSTP